MDGLCLITADCTDHFIFLLLTFNFSLTSILRITHVMRKFQILIKKSFNNLLFNLNMLIQPLIRKVKKQIYK